MEPIRLWRVYCDGWHYTDDEEVSKIGEPIAALTRAAYDALVAERDALRGEVATLRGARSAEDVCEMLCEASCVNVTPERCARIWSLLEHPATTMTTLAVIADERGESYAKAAAERDAATARAERAERAERERDEARALLREARGATTLFLRLLGKAYDIVMPSFRGLFALSKRKHRVEAILARIDALLRDDKAAP